MQKSVYYFLAAFGYIMKQNVWLDLWKGVLYTQL